MAVNKKAKDLHNIVVNKNKTRTIYDVPEATDILRQYGLSTGDQMTRYLIRNKRLDARNKSNNPNDKKSGFEITEKALYDFIVTEIPIMKHFFETLYEKERQVPKKVAKSVPKDEKKTLEASENQTK